MSMKNLRAPIYALMLLCFLIGGLNAQTFWSENFDGAPPVWTIGGTNPSWEIGVPAGSPGEYGSPDPNTAYSITNCLGNDVTGTVNLTNPGNYNNSESSFIVTTAIDCTGMTNVHVRFQRWLNVEGASWDYAYFDVSNDGTVFVPVWDNGTAEITDSEWTQVEYDISATADNQATVYLRWAIDVDGSYQYTGWNIDDVELYEDGGSGPATLVINEFAVEGAGASDEFVEIYNYGTDPVDVSDFRICYRAGTGGASDLVRYTFPGGTIINAGQYYTVGTGAYAPPLTNGTLTAGMSTTGGALALFDGDPTAGGTIVDSVAYGNAIDGHTYLEGGAGNQAPTHSGVASISRCPNGNDTDINSVDFVVTVVTVGIANDCGGSTPIPTLTTIPTETPVDTLVPTETTIINTPVPTETPGTPVINIPADLPYAGINLSNCGNGNTYSDTCLGSYDGGDDGLFMLNVTAPVTIDINFDPKTTTYTGILISDDLANGFANCIDASTYSAANPHALTSISLSVGTYYILIDTWPAPLCVPDFDLNIAIGTTPSTPTITQTPIDTLVPTITETPVDTLVPTITPTTVICDYSEDFETWPLADWTILNNGGDCEWGQGSLDPEDNYTGGTGDFIIANSDGCGSGTTMDTEIISPQYDFTAFTNPQLQFKSDMYAISGSIFNVDISINGTDWDNVLNRTTSFRGPETVSIPLGAYAGQAQVQVRFHYDAPGWHYWWQIDDVCIYDAGGVPDPTSTPVDTPEPTQTPVDTLVPTITPTSIPCVYSEDFDGVTTPDLPTDFTTIFGAANTADTENWVTTSGSYNTMPNSIYIPYCSAAEVSDTYLVWGPIDFTGMTNPTIEFSERVQYAGFIRTHQLMYATTLPATEADFTMAADLNDPDPTTSWLKRTESLIGAANEAQVWIAFHYSGSDGENWYIDDLCVYDAGTGPVPTETPDPFIPTSTPVDTLVPTETETPDPSIPTSTPVDTLVPTETETPDPSIPTSTPVDTLMPTETEVPGTPVPTATETPILPPVNDECADAVELTLGITSDPVHNYAAADNSEYYTHIECDHDFGHKTVWYRFEVTADLDAAELRFDSCQSNFDTVIGLFKVDAEATPGPECDTLAFVDCNDDNDVCGMGGQSAITTTVADGEIYYLVVAGRYDSDTDTTESGHVRALVWNMAVPTYTPIPATPTETPEPGDPTMTPTMPDEISTTTDSGKLLLVFILLALGLSIFAKRVFE